jgi:hypothetical protein
MITTVSTTTVTTVTAIAAMGLTAALSVVATLLLIFFLSIKELAAARGSGTALRFSKFISVGVVPFLIVFAVILIVQIVGILS